jgi:drug/metabolite transporter (DMT)-like permease
MRALQISGAVLIVVGLWMIVRPPSYSSEENVFKLGDIEAKMQQEHRIPGWIGGMALGAGVVLVVAGLKRR